MKMFPRCRGDGRQHGQIYTKSRAAYHEAGHAVACLVYGFPIKEVSIARKAHSAGRVEIECSFSESL